MSGVASSPGSDAAVRLKWGREHRQAGRLFQALRELTVAEDLAITDENGRPGTSDLLIDIRIALAEVLRRIGRSGEARSTLNSCQVAHHTVAGQRRDIALALIEIDAGRVQAARDLLDREPGDAAPTTVRGNWWLTDAVIAWTTGDLSRAIASVEAARAARPGELWGAMCDGHLVVVLGLLGNEDDAVTLGRRAIRVLLDFGMTHEAARVELAVARAIADGARHDEAMTWARAAREEFTHFGSAVDLAECDRVLGACHIATGQWHSAEKYLESALRIQKRLHLGHDALQTSRALAELEIASGRIDLAVRTLDRVLVEFTELGSQWDAAECNILAAMGLLDSVAGPLLSAAMSRGRGQQDPEVASAREHAERAQEVFVTARAVDREALCDIMLATCAALMGQAGPEELQRDLGRLHESCDVSGEIRAEAGRVLGAVWAAQGSSDTAQVAFAAAADEFRQAGMPLESAWVGVEAAWVRHRDGAAEGRFDLIGPLTELLGAGVRLGTATDRTAWEARTRYAAELAFRWAYETGDERLLAELVEVWRNLRVPATTPRIAHAGQRLRAATRWVSARGTTTTLLSGAARYRVREAVRLKMPDGGIALGEWSSDSSDH